MKTIISAAIIASATLFAALPASACERGCDNRDTEVVRPEARQAASSQNSNPVAEAGSRTVQPKDEPSDCSSCSVKEPIVKDERPRECGGSCN